MPDAFEELNTEGPKSGTLLNPLAANTILAGTPEIHNGQKLIFLIACTVAAIFKIRFFSEDDVVFEQQLTAAAGIPTILNLSDIPITFEPSAASHVDIVNCANLVGEVQASILVKAA